MMKKPGRIVALYCLHYPIVAEDGAYSIGAMSVCALKLRTNVEFHQNADYLADHTIGSDSCL